MKKHIISLYLHRFIMLFFLFLILTGCGKDGSSGNTSPAASNTTDETTTSSNDITETTTASNDSADTHNTDTQNDVLCTTIDAYKKSTSGKTEDKNSSVDFSAYNEKVYELFVEGMKGLNSWIEQKNSVVSPASLFQVIGMMMEGASGETLTFLSNRFPFLVSQTSPVSFSFTPSQSLSITNRIWGQKNYKFLTDYLTKMDTDFNPEFHVADFLNNSTGAGTDIYSVLTDTYGMLPRPENKTRVMLSNTSGFNMDINALFSNAVPFDGLFQTFDNVQYRKAHLKISGNYSCYESKTFSAINVESEKSAISMLFIFPVDKSSYYDAIASIKTSIKTIRLSSIRKDVTFSIPELKLDRYMFRNDLSGLVKDKTDFMGVNGLGYLYEASISSYAVIQIDHSSVAASGVSVSKINATDDEPGSVWTNASGVILQVDIVPPPFVRKDTTDSTPFLFVLTDKTTGAVLYIGSLVYPGGVKVE